jgi:hypothetical protein
MNCYRLSTISVLPNIFKNLEILLTSYECNKLALRAQTSTLVRQHNLFLSTVETINNIKSYSKKAKQSFQETKRILKKGAEYPRKAAQGLKQVEEFASKLYGDLDQICIKVVDKFQCALPDKADDYIDIVMLRIICPYYGFIKLGVCIFLYMIKLLCHMMKDLASIFPKASFRIDSIFSFKDYDLKIDELVDPIINQFEFEFETNQNISSQVEQTKSHKEIAIEISTIYNERLNAINSNINKLNMVFPISIVFLLIGALIYHKKYNQLNHFNNNIISVRFYELDENRRLCNQPSVLPLHETLNQNYVSLFDLNLTKKEKQVTLLSIGFLSVSLAPITFFLIVDKLMYNVNSYFRSNTEVKLDLSSPKKVTHEVEGNGFMASTYRHMFGLIDSSNSDSSSFNNTECLPMPEIPNEDVHNQIFVSIIILVLLTCFQSYIKRWRSIIAGFVYPERDRERAVWLFNHLLMLNSGMSFWSDKNTNTKLSGLDKIKRFFLGKIYTICNFFYIILMKLLCCNCFGIIERLSFLQMYYKHKGKFVNVYNKYKGIKKFTCNKCLNHSVDEEDILSCSTLDCKGAYCIECFQIMDNQCKRCLMPLINSSLIQEPNEISFERDSSDEEQDI